MMRTCLAIILVTLCLFTLGLAPRAEAAWAICESTLTGASATAETELEARQNALAAWVEQARALGVAYTRWQLAWNRRLSCEAAEAGQVRCTARGRPCRISQVPPAAGSEILKPGVPSD
jgi:hypothetical protein